MDECGFNSPLIREYGYGFCGEKVAGERSGKRFARTSLIAGLKENKPIAPMTFKGSCDTEVVLAWVRECLIPQAEPGDGVIWDNATFHKSIRIAELLSNAGLKLLFLPPYSPDLNPIEHLWAWIKDWIRSLNDPSLHIVDALAIVFSCFLT